MAVTFCGRIFPLLPRLLPFDWTTESKRYFRDFRNPAQEYGNSDFDIRHRFVFSYLYELPIGHGKRALGDANGVLNQIVGGWQVGGITSVSTGNWFTILDANGVANSDGQQRPDLIGNPRATPCLPNTFFNTCAFADPASGSFGRRQP